MWLGENKIRYKLLGTCRIWKRHPAGLTIPKGTLSASIAQCLFIALLASGCSDPTDGSLSGQDLYPGNPSGARWYSSEQVASGSQILK